MRSLAACFAFFLLPNALQPIVASDDGQSARGANELTGDGKIPWAMLEGEGFRIWHADHELATRVLAWAHQSRHSTVRAWFPNQILDEWQPPCDVYLCPSVREYSVEGRRAPNSSGQALVVKDGDRVLRRKIVLLATGARPLDAIVSHEVAHIVIGSYFQAAEIPRWADEGIAMLNEPVIRQQRYCVKASESVFTFRATGISEVMSQELPSGRQASDDYYTKAYALASFLVDRSGREEFVRFAELSRAGNRLEDLMEFYGFSTIDEINDSMQNYFADQSRTERVIGGRSSISNATGERFFLEENFMGGAEVEALAGADVE